MSLFLVQSDFGDEKKKRIALTDAQNKMVVELQSQIRELDRQLGFLRARGSGMVDAFIASHGLKEKAVRLVELGQGKFALEEAETAPPAAPAGAQPTGEKKPDSAKPEN